MAEKVISTLILKVDLDCHWCYKKIRKILCKLQDKERIRTISYDDGSNSIAVVGAFDPHKLSCMIRCMAGKVIRGVEIMHDGGKKKHKERPKETNPPPPAEPEQPPDSHVSAAMIEVEEKPMEMLPPPAPVENERLRIERFPPPAPKLVRLTAEVITPTVEIPSCPAPPPPAAAGHCGCSSCQPCYQGYYEGCSCGRVYGYAVGLVPARTAGFYGGGYSGCQVYCEEDPASACAVM